MAASTAIRDTRYRLFLSNEEAGRAARAAITLKLGEWDMHGLMDDAKVVASELVTNAARLGKIFSFTLRCLAPGRLRIEVEDFSPGEPELRDPLEDLDREDPDDNGGRGLVLVDALSDAWGVEATPAGKTVWAELTAPGSYGK